MVGLPQAEPRPGAQARLGQVEHEVVRPLERVEPLAASVGGLARREHRQRHQHAAHRPQLHPHRRAGGRQLAEAPDQVNKLADLESRDVLLAKLAGAMKATMTKAAYVFNALPSKAVRTVDALREKQESAA